MTEDGKRHLNRLVPRWSNLLDNEGLKRGLLASLAKLKKVAIFLQIAEQLDASEMQNLLDLDCNVTDHAFVINVSSDADVELEINNARKLSRIFEKLYSRSLEIKYAGGQKDE